MLIAMKGPPGAGKSTLARALSRQLGWPLIDKDDVKDILDGETALAGALSYQVMQRVARRQVGQGLSVICDSPLLERAYMGLRQIAEERGVPLLVIECRCEDETAWRHRIEGRQSLDLPAHHTITWAGVKRFLAQPASNYPIDVPHLIVDTARPLPEVIAEVLPWLTQAGLPCPTAVESDAGIGFLP